jgi:hypothetical protein
MEKGCHQPTISTLDDNDPPKAIATESEAISIQRIGRAYRNGRVYDFTPAELNGITHALQIAQNECAREQANHLKSGNVTMARFHKERVDTFTALLKRFL